MWKQKAVSSERIAVAPESEPARAVPATLTTEAVKPQATVVPEHGVISKGIVVQGEVTGADPLLVEGTVEGIINIPGERVTVGRNGLVMAHESLPGPCITAREILILGKVIGNLVALDRIDIRAEGSLSGDVSTGRVSIEDGAYFRGGIDIRREETEAEAAPELVSETVETS